MLRTAVMVGATVLLGAAPVPAMTGDGADGGIGIRLVGVPTTQAPTNQAPTNRAALADDPRARAYIVDHLAPGTTIRRRVEVINRGSATRHVQVYAGGAAVTGTEFTFVDDALELLSWTSIDRSGADLAA